MSASHSKRGLCCLLSLYIILKKEYKNTSVLESCECVYHNIASDAEIMQLVICWGIFLLLNCSHFIGEIESMVYAQYGQDDFSGNLNVSVPCFLF